MAGLGRRFVFALVLAGLATGLAPRAAWGQMLEPGAQPSAPNPLTDTTANPGKVLLFSLESQFAKDVAARGGAGFASWFADDAVLLGNGQPPVVGRAAIAKSANWSPQSYQLTWTPLGAVMDPSGNIGYTWSHYEGHSKDAGGSSVNTSGRFITIWRKQPDGSWKVALDAGANEPAPVGDCCRIPEAGSK